MARSNSCETPESVVGRGTGAGAGIGPVAGSLPGGGRPLIITEDPLLLDDLLRLCAAAGAEPHVHHAVPGQGGA